MVRENVDVIVCVEATSVGGYNIKNIKSEYLIPALEYYSGTQGIHGFGFNSESS